jgi:hypothetical protein
VWAGALGVCALSLAANLIWSDLDPRSPWGMAYGIAAAVLLLVACLYAVRRRLPKRGPLRAHVWLQLHVFTGTLFLVLVLMHSGMRLPEGRLGWALWLLSLWVAFSGAVGLLLQWWIPRALSSGLTTEVHYDRIPALVATATQRAEALVARSGDSLRRYYRDTLAALMAGPQPRLIYFVDVTGGIQAKVKDFEYLARFADPDEARRIVELRDLLTVKLEADAHYTLQRVLRWWVYGHVPVVGLLIALVIVHIASILYY